MQSGNVAPSAAVGGTARTGLHIVRYFPEPILRAQFLYLPVCGKALKSSMVTTVPRDARLHETCRDFPGTYVRRGAYPPSAESHAS